MLHDDFFRAFLQGLNLPVRKAGLRALAGVSIFESSQGDLRWWNPLAVTTPLNGSVPLYPDYEGACAQVYKSFADGVAASVQLFSGPHWSGVRAAIESNWFRKSIISAFSSAYTWVTPRPNFDFGTKALDARRVHPLD